MKSMELVCYDTMITGARVQEFKATPESGGRSFVALILEGERDVPGGFTDRVHFHIHTDAGLLSVIQAFESAAEQLRKARGKEILQ